MKASSILLVTALAVIIFGGLLLYGDVQKVRTELVAFPWWLLLPSLALAFGNYVIRFFKWHFFLRVLNIKIGPRISAEVFFSGLAMAITPGKVGELLKAYLLLKTSNVPMSDTVPVVVAERLTDLLSLVILAGFGTVGFAYGIDILVIALAMCAVVIGLTLWTPGFRFCVELACRIRPLRRHRQTLLDLQSAMARLVGPWPLLVGTVLSVAAWGAECMAFYVVFQGVGTEPTLNQAAFIYSLGTLAGAVSMLPGGLVATEAGMVAMLVGLMALATSAQAVTGVFIVRLCTLWFAVPVGLLGLMAIKKRLGLATSRSLVDEARSSR